jgi:hypothetical protein
LSIENDGESGCAACFCGEEIAGAVVGTGLGNGDAAGLVIGVLNCGCIGFSACVTAGVIGGGGESSCDISIDDGVIDAGDGDGLSCIPVRLQ